MGAVAFNIRQLDSRHILALFSLELPSSVVINSCVLRYKDDRRTYTVSPPRIPLVQEDRQLTRSGNGELVYTDAISFRTSAARQQFNRTALTALYEADPSVFTRGPLKIHKENPA